MRLMLLAALLWSGAAVPAIAAGPCPQGEPTIVRVSKITPAGSMAGFNAAVRAHDQWYASHGYKSQQRTVPVLALAQGGPPTVSTSEIMTIRTGDTVPRDKHDAAWDAYVAQYRANSDLVSEYFVCMPAN